MMSKRSVYPSPLNLSFVFCQNKAYLPISLSLVYGILPSHFPRVDFCLTDLLSPMPPSQTRHTHTWTCLILKTIEPSRFPSVRLSRSLFEVFLFFSLRIVTQERCPCICCRSHWTRTWNTSQKRSCVRYHPPTRPQGHTGILYNL